MNWSNPCIQCLLREQTTEVGCAIYETFFFCGLFTESQLYIAIWSFHFIFHGWRFFFSFQVSQCWASLLVYRRSIHVINPFDRFTGHKPVIFQDFLIWFCHGRPVRLYILCSTLNYAWTVYNNKFQKISSCSSEVDRVVMCSMVVQA